jgi:hypothetical protein
MTSFKLFLFQKKNNYDYFHILKLELEILDIFLNFEMPCPLEKNALSEEHRLKGTAQYIRTPH